MQSSRPPRRAKTQALAFIQEYVDRQIEAREHSRQPLPAIEDDDLLLSDSDDSDFIESDDDVDPSHSSEDDEMEMDEDDDQVED